jgi:Cys-tRNA(Pro) deacylase
MMLSPKSLDIYCKNNGIKAEIVSLKVPASTVSEAAQAVGCSSAQIVKTVLFLVSGEPVITIANGEARIDRRAIADFFQSSKKKVRLANVEDVQRLTGYAAGGLPPFGHSQELPTLIDFRVLEQEEIYAGGGSEFALIRMRSEEIRFAFSAHVIDLITPGGFKR